MFELNITNKSYTNKGRDVVYSKPFGEMSRGDIILGNMTQIGSENWYINCLNTNSKKNSDMTIDRSILKTQPWIYVTLEVYQTYNCNEYPPKGTAVPFTNLKLYENGQVTPPFDVFPPLTDINPKLSII